MRARCHRPTPKPVRRPRNCGCRGSTFRSTASGTTRVAVGEATLPNGILTTAEFDFASTDWPSDFTIAEGVVQLTVRSLDHPERLFWNIYDHGWIEGTERVEAILEFDVLHHDPGAVLSIADVVVR